MTWAFFVFFTGGWIFHHSFSNSRGFARSECSVNLYMIFFLLHNDKVQWQSHSTWFQLRAVNSKGRGVKHFHLAEGLRELKSTAIIFFFFSKRLLLVRMAERHSTVCVLLSNLAASRTPSRRDVGVTKAIKQAGGHDKTRKWFVILQLSLCSVSSGRQRELQHLVWHKFQHRSHAHQSSQECDSQRR